MAVVSPVLLLRQDGRVFLVQVYHVFGSLLEGLLSSSGHSAFGPGLYVNGRPCVLALPIFHF